MTGRGRLAPDGVLVIATFVWGATFVVVHEAIRDVSPLLFVALRFTLATLLLAPFVLRTRGLPGREALGAGVRVGIWLYAGFALQTVGLRTTEPARAAFITGLSVVLVPLLLLVLLRRLPATGSLVGAALAAAGLTVLTGVGHGELTTGDLAVLGCAVAFAMHVITVGRYAARIGPAHLLLVQLATVVLVAWPAALLLEAPSFRHGAAGWFGLGATVLFATLGALGAQNWAQQRTPPTRAAIILTLEPVFAALVSAVFTDERFGARELGAAALILTGMLLAQFAPSK